MIADDNTLRRVALALALLSTAATNTGVAQDAVAEASEAEKQTARDAYAQGKDHFEAGRYADALAAFETSYANVASPNSKLMIARCLEHLGRVAEAHAAFGVTIAEAGGSEKYAPAAQAAEAERAQLASKVGTVEVEVGGDAAGGTLTVQGRAIAADAWGEPVVVDPGDIEVVLTTADGEDRQTVHVGPGGSAVVSVTAAPAAEPAMLDMDAALGPEDGASGPTPMAKRAQVGLIIGPKVGGGLGTGPLGASYVLELELGYALPFADRALEVFVSGQYTSPETDGKEGEQDPRLPGDGVLSYQVTQQELALSLGLLYRIDVGSDLVMPYGGAGARLYLLKTEVEGDAGGEAFGSNEETQSDVGFLIVGGVDIFLGPGALLAELQYGWAKVDGFVLRNTNVGQLNLAIGYRFVF